LGKWGVNHAADPVVTRWKRDDKGQKVNHAESGKPILQFVSIRRLDTNEWAIPGVITNYTDRHCIFQTMNIINHWNCFEKGMCDPGEKISQTLKREFMEEATDCLGSNQDSREQIEHHLTSLFENGVEVSNRPRRPKFTHDFLLRLTCFFFSFFNRSTEVMSTIHETRVNI
jgi:ADP-ribose pyrophosphatase